MDKSFSFQTAKGAGKVVYNEKGVRELILPEVLPGKGEEISFNPPQPSRFATDLKSSLEKYFTGCKINFSSVQVDLTGFSRFEREVYQVIQTIPYGTKRSYRWVAKKMGRPQACRAVGKALSKNRVPIIISCHRVVKENDDLGGWSGPPGWKKKLLMLESSWGKDK